MKSLRFILFIGLVTSLFSEQILAQERENKKEEKGEAFFPHHTIGIVIAHANIFDGVDESGNKKILTLPAWGIDYTYQFHPKWAIGLHTDIIIEKYEVQKKLSSSDEVIERSYPVAPALVGIFKPTRHWSFLFGAGVEFEKDENFFLNRAGIEYGGELPKNWEVFGSLSYDFKWNAYDTWLVGIGIAKSFGGK